MATKKTTAPTNPEQKKTRKPRAKKTPKAILEMLTNDIKESLDEGQTESMELTGLMDPGGLTVTCPKCSFESDVLKSSVVQKGGMICPECKHWIYVRLHPDKSRYVRGLGTTASGSDTLDIADETADILRGLALDELYDKVSDLLEMVGRNKMSKSFLKGFGKDTPWEMDNIQAYLTDRFSGRNPGMQRMNLGNILRAAQKRASK